MIEVTVSADPDSPVFRTLDKLDLTLSPASIAGFLKNFVVSYLQGRAEQRFAMEGDDASGKWAPLKQSTIAIRQSEGYGAGPINVRTGELREYVVGNPGTISMDVGATLEWPTGLPDSGDMFFKYRVAQSGTMNGRVPARPVAAISFHDMVAINALLGGFISGAKAVGK